MSNIKLKSWEWRVCFTLWHWNEQEKYSGFERKDPGQWLENAKGD